MRGSNIFLSLSTSAGPSTLLCNVLQQKNLGGLNGGAGAGVGGTICSLPQGGGARRRTWRQIRETNTSTRRGGPGTEPKPGEGAPYPGSLSGESFNLWEEHQGDTNSGTNGEDRGGSGTTLRWKEDTARDQHKDMRWWAATMNLERGTTGLRTPVASGTGRPTFVSTTYQTLPLSRNVTASMI